MKRKRHINRFKKSPFKQGVYSPVNREKYKSLRLPEYRSSWELKFFKWCDSNPAVLEWNSESVIVPYLSPVDNKLHRYFIDGFISLKEGTTVRRYLIEIKPYKQTIPPIESKRKKKSTILYEKMTYAVNQAKWNAARQFAQKRNLEFIILTENELNV